MSAFHLPRSRGRSHAKAADHPERGIGEPGDHTAGPAGEPEQPRVRETPVTAPCRAAASADVSAEEPSRPPVLVTVSTDLADEAAPLAKALGPGYDIRVGPPKGSGVAVLSPRGTAVMAFYRVRHPDTAFLVVERCAEQAEQGAAEYLNGGADGYLAGQPTVVIAAQIQALVRRQATAVSAPADEGVQRVIWGL